MHGFVTVLPHFLPLGKQKILRTQFFYFIKHTENAVTAVTGNASMEAASLHIRQNCSRFLAVSSKQAYKAVHLSALQLLDGRPSHR